MHPFTAAHVRRLTLQCWSTISYIRYSACNRLTRSWLFSIAFSSTYCCLSSLSACYNNIGAFSVCRRSSTAGAAAVAFNIRFSPIHPTIQATGKPDRCEGEISFEQCKQQERQQEDKENQRNEFGMRFSIQIYSAHSLPAVISTRSITV